MACPRAFVSPQFWSDLIPRNLDAKNCVAFVYAYIKVFRSFADAAVEILDAGGFGFITFPSIKFVSGANKTRRRCRRFTRNTFKLRTPYYYAMPIQLFYKALFTCKLVGGKFVIYTAYEMKLRHETGAVLPQSSGSGFNMYA